MEIIPVIDVKGGVAVAAQGGARETYRPLNSPIADGSSKIDAVVNGYLVLHPFRTIYIADLDAIEGRCGNHRAINEIVDKFPDRDLWVDNGDATPDGIARLISARRVSAVVGSESKIDHDTLAKLVAIFGDRLILSLDFAGDQFRGDEALLLDSSIWPGRVIVMTLARVGMGKGPDITRLTDIAARAGPRRVYAAGGVRGLDDLRASRNAGAQGALIATALHTGQIKTGDLEEIAGW